MKILKTLGSAVLIITFITGIWFIDDRYVDAKEIKDIKEQINLRIDTYEYRELN
jgi:Mg2+ and Co2+ transporter CorA